MSHVDVGNRIKGMREIRNMTREELAEKSGISSKFLYEIELGKKGLSADTLLKISKTLSCSCDYVLTGQNRDNNEAFLKKFDPDKRKQVRRLLNLIEDLCGNKNEKG